MKRDTVPGHDEAPDGMSDAQSAFSGLASPIAERRYLRQQLSRRTPLRKHCTSCGFHCDVCRHRGGHTGRFWKKAKTLDYGHYKYLAAAAGKT
jgi:hypothetical protein